MMIQIHTLTTLADTFIRANSATTINPASDGGSWTPSSTSGTWGIASNQGYVAATSGLNFIGRNLGSSAVDMSVDVFIPAGNTDLIWLDFAANGSDRPNAGWSGYEIGGFDGTAATGVTLHRIVAGSALTAASAHPADFRNATSTIRVTYDGAGNIQVFLNGVSQFTYFDSSFATFSTFTWVLLGTSENANPAGIRFDNFSAAP